MYLYLFVFLILFPSICFSFSPLDKSILGWPSYINDINSGVAVESQYSVWLDKGDNSLRQEMNSYTFRRTFKTADLSTTFSAYSHQDKYLYEFDENTFQVDENFDAWELSASYENWKVKLGNRYQSIGFSSLWAIELSRSVTHRHFSLDIQHEIDNPIGDQFIFNHQWRDHRWNLHLNSQNFHLLLNARENENNDHGIILMYANNKLKHSLTFQKTDLNYGFIDLSDNQYSYGKTEWSNEGKLWLWQSNLTLNQSNFWTVSIVNQKLSFTTVGQASLFNILGQSSSLAGANWFWGVQGSFKSIGIKADRGWNTKNVEQTLGLSFNKLSPYVNSKLYKSLILIGLPKLESEDDLDINYAYVSLLSWTYKYNWKKASLKLSASQLIPIHINENSKESNTSGSGSSGSRDSYTHSGYNINIFMSWYF